MSSNACVMDIAELRSKAGKWCCQQEKENPKMTRPLPNVQCGTLGWVNRDGCISERQERTALKECTNIQTVCTIPSTRQHAKKVTIIPSNSKSKFRVTPGHKSARKPNKRNKAQQKSQNDVMSPSYVVVKDDAMEVAESHELFTHQCMNKLPLGVRDADSNVTVYLCPEYACDIISYLQEVELRWAFPCNFLEDESEVTPRMRAILMDWLNQVQNHENLNEDSLHLTVAMIDRYTSIHKLRLTLLQLLGITCLLIAAKYNERFPPEISTLCKLTDDTYTVSEVLGMEIIVLKTLQFDLNIPTPIIFLRRFIGTQTYSSEEYNLCEYLLDLSITNHLMVAFRPSLVAASTLYIARLVFQSDLIWTPTLAYYTKYVKSDLQDCITILSKMLYKAESKDLQGARTKFSSSKRDSISKHEILKDNIDIRNAANGMFPSNR